MSAEKQYIELYEAQKELINANSAVGLNAYREEAYETLKREGLKKAKEFSAPDPEDLISQISLLVAFQTSALTFIIWLMSNMLGKRRKWLRTMASLQEA